MKSKAVRRRYYCALVMKNYQITHSAVKSMAAFILQNLQGIWRVIRGQVQACARSPRFYVLLIVATVSSQLVSPLMSIDSAVLANQYLNDFVIPHFPPLYPLFVRVLLNVGAVFSDSAGIENLGLIEPPNVEPINSRLVMLVQHLITMGSVTFFVDTLVRNRALATILAICLYFSPLVFLQALMFQTEALAWPAATVCSAFAIRLAAHEGFNRKNLFGLAIFAVLATLSRHTMIFFAGVPLIIVMLQQIFSNKRRSVRAFISICAISVGVGAVSYGTVSTVSTLVMSNLKIEPRSVFGRAFSNTLELKRVKQGVYLPGHTEESLLKMVDDVSSSSLTSQEAAYAKLILNADIGWVAPFNIIFDDIKRECPGCSYSMMWAQTDEILNAIARSFMFSGHPAFLNDVLLRTDKYLCKCFVELHDISIPMFSSKAAGQYKGLEIDNIQENYLFHGRSLEILYLPIFDNIRRASFNVSLAAALLILFIARSNAHSILPATIVIISTAYSLSSSFVTIYIHRYGLFVDYMSILSLVIAVTVIIKELVARNDNEYIKFS